MVVKLEGKEDRHGTSRKTGKDYHFIVLHFLLVQQGVEGISAQQVLCDPSVIPYDKLLVGQMYDIEFDFRGNILSVTPAKQ